MKKLLIFFLLTTSTLIYALGAKNEIAFPQLKKMPNFAAQHRVNLLLAAKQREDIDLKNSCLKVNPPSVKNYWHESITILYQSKKILSLKVHYAYYCGNAYPDEHNEYLNYDLIKGKFFNFNDIFIPAVTSAFPNDPIKKIAAEIYQKKSTHKKSNPQCLKTYDNKQANTYQLAFNQQGLIFSLKLPHATQICATEIIIPYEKIKPLLSKQGHGYLPSPKR